MSKIVKREDGYWIVGLPMNTPDCGPYEKLTGDNPETCAKEALKGLDKFFIHDCWEGGYIPKQKVRVKVKNLLTD